MKSYTAFAIVLIPFTLTSTLPAAITIDADSNGWAGWTEQNTSANSTENGRVLAASGTAMDTTGVSWGLYANSFNSARNIYDFGSELGVGDSVTVNVSLGDMTNANSWVGISLIGTTGLVRFETLYQQQFGTDDAFLMSDADSNELAIGPDTSKAASSWANGNFQKIVFTQEAGNSYSITFNGVAVTNTGLNLSGSDISKLQIFNSNSGSGDANNAYFNSVTTTVPEPRLFVFAMGLAGLAVCCRRRFLKSFPIPSRI